MFLIWSLISPKVRKRDYLSHLLPYGVPCGAGGGSRNFMRRLGRFSHNPFMSKGLLLHSLASLPFLVSFARGSRKYGCAGA